MNRRQVGGEYEERAARFLASRGYRIVEKNYRSRRGEIDLIGWEGGYLAFVEVKYRRNAGAGGALEAVNLMKQRKISGTALAYLRQKRIPAETPCRFDVVGIDKDKVTLVKNAFDFCGGNGF